jgi:hypothetical protein
MIRLEDSRPDAFATDMPEIYRSRRREAERHHITS